MAGAPHAGNGLAQRIREQLAQLTDSVALYFAGRAVRRKADDRTPRA